jgi:hypothetical protein
MSIAGIISEKEHKILLTMALTTLIMAVVSFVSFTIEDYNREVKIQQADLVMEANDGLSFSKDYGTDYRPFHRLQLTFLTLFIFLGLLRAKQFLFSIFFTLLSVFIFAMWFFRTNKAIELNKLYMAETPYLLRIATYYDYSVFLLILILLCWQLSIFIRMLLRSQQKGVELI